MGMSSTRGRTTVSFNRFSLLNLFKAFYVPVREKKISASAEIKSLIEELIQTNQTSTWWLIHLSGTQKKVSILRMLCHFQS